MGGLPACHVEIEVLILLLCNVTVALLRAVPAAIRVALDVHVLAVQAVGDLAHDCVQLGRVAEHEQAIESLLDTV